MIRIRVFCFLLIYHFLQLVLAAKCPTSFLCGNLGYIKFPFTTPKRPDCGILAIHGCDHTEPAANKTIQIESPFNVVKVHHHTIVIVDENLHKKLQNKCCEAFTKNITLPPISPLASFEIEDNITMFRCNHPLNFSDPKHSCHHKNCSGYNIYYSVPNTEKSESPGCPSSLKSCSMIQLSSRDITDTNDPFTFLTSEISIHVHLSDDCEECSKGRGQCQLDSSGNFYCSKVTAAERWALKLGLGIGLPTIVIGLLIGWLYKRKRASLNVQLQTRNTDNNSNPEQESSSTIYFGVPVFSYKELLETTNNFNANRKLGDGGSGTVYYGKLRDGREVAIKRLYDHNYKRVQQFMNEVKILTCLRHKNLVSLYGCTSLHSNELLLVYEYIPNGTIACHLHGNLANLGLLSWPIRMNIAIETASALAYLHASDIIHRDVKTKNILLDNKYSVKIADFGLSRLFSNDVSHVSTAPQGTRGYIDPEYFQCHQLTSKSDVYSFGVILIELISSMPPVDMTRHKDEINLAFLAMKMIRNDTISELVDPSLGFHSNNDVKRTIISVATLAFRCLQWEKELRPSMDEVLEVLKRIESGKDELGDLTKANVHKAGINSCNINVMPASNSLDCDVVGLLKDAKSMPSPITVTDNWESKCTTPNVSC